jgi:hypothetical protein
MGVVLPPLWHQGHNARRPIANLRPRFGAGFFLQSLLAQLRSQHRFKEGAATKLDGTNFHGYLRVLAGQAV